MPVRASGKEIGSSVGEMVFRGLDEKRIQRRLEKVGSAKLQMALAKRGVSDVNVRDIAKAMTGEGRGWSQLQYKKVVAALQDVEIAQKTKSASSMVLRASRQAQGVLEGPKLSPEQIKARMEQLARERRAEANAEEEETEASVSVLDRMRGAMGHANKIDQIEEELKVDQGPDDWSKDENTIRVTRERLRKDLGLQPRIRLPKAKRSNNSGTGFQS